MLPFHLRGLSSIRHVVIKGRSSINRSQLLLSRLCAHRTQHSSPLLHKNNVLTCQSFATISGPQPSDIDATFNVEGGYNPSNSSYLVSSYESMVEGGSVDADQHQVRALTELDRLRSEWLTHSHSSETDKGDDESKMEEEDNSFFTRLFSPTQPWANADMNVPKTLSTALSPPLKGVYLHGGVGCGKTFCMDLFYDSIPEVDGATKQKVHFHKFMLNVHKQMHEAKMIEKVEGDVLPRVIERTLEKGRLLCFDEFQVTDVADALILRRLFTGLMEKGAVIVVTSNRPPCDLYLNGLQRDLFLPFLDLLDEHLNGIPMWESDIDYRLVKGQNKADVYFVGKESKVEFESLFIQLTKGSSISPATLDVQGRSVFIPKASVEYGIARFSFYDLCGEAKGVADYLAIGERFHTVFLEDVPALSLHEVNLVRRFILLIDSLYECHVKVVVHAKTPPEGIFEVDLKNNVCDEVFAFDRTRSRLEEMRSKYYLRHRWTGLHS